MIMLTKTHKALVKKHDQLINQISYILVQNDRYKIGNKRSLAMITKLIVNYKKGEPTNDNNNNRDT